MQYLKKRIMLFRCLYAPRHTAYKTKKIIFIWKYGGREYCSKSEKPPPAKRCFFCGLFNKRLGAVEFVLSYRFGRFLICSRLLGHWCRAPLLASGVPSHILSGITDHFLSENREPINEFLDCQQPRLANCLFLCCHRLNSLNLASLH